MNYKEFLIYKKELKEKNIQLLDCSNNNIYEYYKNILEPISNKVDKQIYRCHLVEDYLTYLNLENNLKQFIGASNGVRESLLLLFKYFNNKIWNIPYDIYPFYIENSESIYNKKLFKTLNNNNIFQNLNNGITLITFPLKPQGRVWNYDEIKTLKEWLKNKNNLLIIDMVYLLNNKIPNFIYDLYIKTNQIILLHSLSKVFLLPKTFGITLLPNNDLGLDLKEKYKMLKKNQEYLNIAFNALNNKKIINKKIIKDIKYWSMNKQKIFNLNINKDFPMYLFYSNVSHEEYIQKNILTIPESVFGGKGNGSIISIIPE